VCIAYTLCIAAGCPHICQRTRLINTLRTHFMQLQFIFCPICALIQPGFSKQQKIAYRIQPIFYLLQRWTESLSFRFRCRKYQNGTLALSPFFGRKKVSPFSFSSIFLYFAEKKLPISVSFSQPSRKLGFRSVSHLV